MPQERSRPPLHPDARCFSCPSRERTEWCTLDGDDLELLARSKVCNVYAPGQVIFYEGNACLGVHCVESGTVALRRSDGRGGAVLSELVGPGRTLGYRAYFAGRGYAATAEALTECRICFVDRAAVRSLLERSPTVGHAFLRRMADDHDVSEAARVRALTLPLRARTAHLLLAMKDRSSTVDDDGTLRVDLPLSRKDLAAMLGARPETLSRTIRAFADEGIARFEARRVVVPDLDALIDQLEREE